VQNRNCWLDIYGSAGLISAATFGLAETFWRRLAQAKQEPTLDSVYVRCLVHGPSQDDRPIHYLGQTLSEPFLVAENGLWFEVDFIGGYSTGLFADQQSNRLRLRELRPQTLLNLFSYTCAFSVAAAAEGGMTTSVDLAGRCLERAKRNFSVNGLDPLKHRFIKEDVFSYLRRSQRKGEKYDGIVVDPPTFSRGEGGKIFRAERDWPRLLDGVLPLLAANGWIFLSTNCRSIDLGKLKALAQAAARRQGWSDFFIQPGVLPAAYLDSPSSVTLWGRRAE
jgi:23S rRNA (cytosine1962-C5)-methyltransferase